jgi:hypothetical protein
MVLQRDFGEHGQRLAQRDMRAIAGDIAAFVQPLDPEQAW